MVLWTPAEPPYKPILIYGGRYDRGVSVLTISHYSPVIVAHHSPRVNHLRLGLQATARSPASLGIEIWAKRLVNLGVFGASHGIQI